MESRDKVETSILELATLVMSCSRTSIEEGQRYSPIRFLEVFRKLCDLPDSKDVAILREIREEIADSIRNNSLRTDEQRIRFTDEKIRRLVEKLKQDNGLS